MLSSEEGETNHDSERRRSSEGHSHSVERRARDKSGQPEKRSERVALASWRAQGERQVKMVKDTR
jgi:hypothetical protein